jgi:NDP-sugar pyrophosphorylase family protein
MIGVALTRLCALGYRNVALLTSRDPEAAGAAIEAYAASGFGARLALTLYRERYPLGTAGAVYAALRHMRNELIVVIPGDTLFPFETLNAALAAHDWQSRDATWLVTTQPGPHAQNPGALIVDPATHCIVFALEGPEAGPPPETIIRFKFATSTGALIFGRVFFMSEFEKYMSRLEKPEATDLYREFVPWLVSRGHEVAAFDIGQAAQDLGSPERLLAFGYDDVPATGASAREMTPSARALASSGADHPLA